MLKKIDITIEYEVDSFMNKFKIFVQEKKVKRNNLKIKIVLLFVCLILAFLVTFLLIRNLKGKSLALEILKNSGLTLNQFRHDSVQSEFMD